MPAWKSGNEWQVNAKWKEPAFLVDNAKSRKSGFLISHGEGGMPAITRPSSYPGMTPKMVRDQ